MKNPVSSFRADARSAPWYRQCWPWLLAAGPAIVVAASLATAVVAARSDDGLVAEDYYKRGLLINEKLKRDTRSAVRDVSATLKFGPEGRVHVRLEGTAEPVRHVRLHLTHPTPSRRDQIILLESVGENEYAGRLAGDMSGRWIVTLETDTWRLPTTTVDGLPSLIRLGTAAAS